jgi:hypothetical protein
MEQASNKKEKNSIHPEKMKAGTMISMEGLRKRVSRPKDIVIARQKLYYGMETPSLVNLPIFELTND